MDHRVTVMVIIVFGGVIAFTFFTATLYTSVGPEVAAAAAGGTGGAGAEPEPPSPREQLLHLLAVLDRRAADWEREHRGRRPDFNTYPDANPNRGGLLRTCRSREVCTQIHG